MAGVMTSTVAFQGVWGNSRVAVLKVASAAASGSVSGGGIGYCFAATISPISMVTTGANVKVNVLEGATAAAGSVALQALTSGDSFYVTLIGRS